MIKSNKGKVIYEGTTKDLIGDFICITKALLEEDVFDPVNLMNAISIALEGQGVKVIRATEEELKEVLEEMAEEDEPDDDSDGIDDIFGFLRGDNE